MPYPMDPAVWPYTLFVDSQDVQLMQGVMLERDALSGLFTPGAKRGGNEKRPRVRGSRRRSKVFDEFAFQIPTAILPHDGTGVEPVGIRQRMAQTWDNYTALFELWRGSAGDGLVSLTRRRPTASGHQDHTAAGEFTGVTGLTWVDNECLQLVVNGLNTDACWFDGATVVMP